MSKISYRASVYTRDITYVNFKGEEKTVTLEFALHPLRLLEVIAGYKPKKSKSANPARRDQVEPMSDDQQLKFVKDLACMAAGFSSTDGESWEPFPDFENQLAGQAFLTKLAASDQDREEFAQKVILDPFRSFVEFSKAEEGTSAKEIQDLDRMLAQMEQVFSGAPAGETAEEKRVRLQKELEALNTSDQS